MKTNKLDNNIKEKLENRTFKPSASAWERLSIQLDEQEQKKKKGWFFYIGYAASILILISVGFWFFSSDENQAIPENIIVEAPIDTVLIDKKINELFNEVPVEEAIVNNEKVEEKQIINNKNGNPTKEESIKTKIDNAVIEEKTEIAIVEKNTNNIQTIEEPEIKSTFKQDSNPRIKINSDDLLYAVTHDNEKVMLTEKPSEEKIESYKQDPNSSIKINSDDLLFAVTHNKEEVKTYYAKYNINRDDVLKTIQNQLKESNLKVNPSTILAEVERNIDEDAFQNNFMKSLKKRVTDIASAIASRND